MRWFQKPPEVNIEELQRELEVTDRLLNESNRVLAAIPDCPVHGPKCIPYALDWVEKAKKLLVK